MLQSFFNGLSGMFSFSQSLDTVSNNIANMNTPGFKGSDTFYKSLTSGDSSYGTQISGQEQRFSTGEIRQTGNSGDLAISGDGFFILLQDGETRYTRAGQFSFDDDGYLIDSSSGGQVAAVNDSGQLESINIENARALAPQVTSEVTFSGNLSTDMSEHTISDVAVFNLLGEQSLLSFEFTNNSATTSGSWLVSVTDEAGSAVHSGEIRFGSDGTPVDAFSSLMFDLTDSKGNSSELSVDFGESGLFSGSTSVSGGDDSSIQATVADGYGIGALTTIGFDSEGILQLSYSNGEVVDGSTLALATFTNTSTLKVFDGSIFAASDLSGRSIGQAGESGFGSIISESIELSNVDLSTEFADMIIIQRGYQASSRILNVANELLDDLYENTRG